MAIYCVTGKLGSGKTLACVGRIRDALLSGKRVATNLNLNLSALLPSELSHANVIRVADKPTLVDLNFIGEGNLSCDESKNGLLVLDELGAWFNARAWADKSRQSVIDWLLHSRKHGWDVYLIIQHPKMLDSQAREGLVEFLVTCRRLDRLRVPFIGGLVKSLTGILLTLPKVHIGTVRYGMEKDAIIADRWVYRATELYAAYDTKQIFTDKRVEPYKLPWVTIPRVPFWDFLTYKPVKPLPKPKSTMISRIQALPDHTMRLAFLKRLELFPSLAYR